MRYLHTMIRASDLDKTLSFFVDHLGLVEVRRYDSEQGPLHACVSRGA
jgi:lactoylglutathione lyase